MRQMFLVLAIASSAAIAAPIAKPPKYNEKALRAGLEEKLKDADSAKIKDITYSPTNNPKIWNICGSVNAKNGYGAYSGFGRFYGLVAEIEKGQPMYSISSVENDSSNRMCEHFGL